MGDSNPQFIRQLLTELRDMNKDKRRAAVMKLGMLGGDEAVRALMNAVQNDYEDLIVRGRAALMLGKIGDNRAVEPLIRALDAPGYQTKLNAAEALGRLGDSRAIEPLAMLAASDNGRASDAAQEALRLLGHNPETPTDKPEPELT